MKNEETLDTLTLPVATELLADERSNTCVPGSFTVGRDEVAYQALECLIRSAGRLMPVITGISGAGKTNLLKALEERMKRLLPTLEFCTVDAGVLFSCASSPTDKEARLEHVLESAQRSSGVIAIENAGVLTRETEHGEFMLSHALDAGCRIIGTSLPGQFACGDPLRRRVKSLPLSPLSSAEAEEVLHRARPFYEDMYKLTIDENCLRACLALCDAGVPGLLLDLLAGAAGRVHLSGANVCCPDDIRRASVFRAVGSTDTGPDDGHD